MALRNVKVQARKVQYLSIYVAGFETFVPLQLIVAHRHANNNTHQFSRTFNGHFKSNIQININKTDPTVRLAQTKQWLLHFLTNGASLFYK